MRPRKFLFLAVLGGLLLALSVPVGAQQESRDPDPGGQTGASSDLNRNFTDPDLDVQRWVDRFEGESREVFVARHEILKATGAAPGHRVADVGAGTGLYTRLFSEIVGERGWVYAVDISTGFLEHINETVSRAGIDNVTAVLGQVDTMTLPPESVDLIFICDTYHHFEQVEPMMASIESALAPGGRLVVIDFERVEGTSREWILDHVRAGKETFRAEIESTGLRFVEEVEIAELVENYMLVFQKGK